MDVNKFAELIFNKDKREEFIKETQELLGDIKDRGKEKNGDDED